MISSPVDELVSVSRQLAADPSVVLFGGGNSSLKGTSRDFRGRSLEVMWVKASGADMKDAGPEFYPAVDLEAVRAAASRPALTAAEMVEWVTRCLLDPGARRPSIETMMHAFLPDAAVLHSHADAILAIADNASFESLVPALFGGRVFAVPYVIPGFELALAVASLREAHAAAEGCLLRHHGLVTWGPDLATAYSRHLSLLELAQAALPSWPELEPRSPSPFPRDFALRLRGLLGGGVLLFDASARDFAASPEGQSLSQVGAATPDHMLQTKRVALFSPAASIASAIESYAAEYTAYARRQGGDAWMKDPRPRVVLVPEHGLFAHGTDLRSATAALEIYRHTVRVMQAASSLGVYVSLDESDAYAMEYFGPELDKLRSGPPPPELAGRVALVTGAARGIGAAVADKLAALGAVVVRSDLAAGADLVLDVTSEESVAAGVSSLLERYGGLDIVVSNAGALFTGPVESLSLADWERSLAVNATGHFLVCREALRCFRSQGLGGAIVINATKNVLAPGAEMAAYSSSKAAAAQLARVLAIEGGPLGVRVNVVHPDQVFTDLWSPEVRESRARAHGVPVSELEAFYASRSLLKVPVRPRDVAEAVAFFCSPRSSRSTGNLLLVDAGSPASFPR